MIEDDLKELIGDDGQFQLIAMPDEHLSLVNSRDRNLEVVVGRHTEIFRRVEELMWKDDVESFLVLRDYESAGEERMLDDATGGGTRATHFPDSTSDKLSTLVIFSCT